MFRLWQRLAAPDLLRALGKALAALNTATRFAVPSLGSDSYTIAAECERAIALAKNQPKCADGPEAGPP